MFSMYDIGLPATYSLHYWTMFCVYSLRSLLWYFSGNTDIYYPSQNFYPSQLTCPTQNHCADNRPEHMYRSWGGYIPEIYYQTVSGANASWQFSSIPLPCYPSDPESTSGPQAFGRYGGEWPINEGALLDVAYVILRNVPRCMRGGKLTYRSK